MDVRHLELLRDLADHGSITAVAEATHRTPSAVSQQLKIAQRSLGAPLVEPDGRGLRLTDAGRLLAEGAIEVTTALERVQARWDSFREAPSGSVSIAMLPSVAEFLLAGVLHDLEASIEVEATDVDVAEEEFGALVVDHDVVLAHSLTREAPAGTAGLRTVHLAHEPLDIALPSTHPLAAGSAVRAEDLIDEQWIAVPVGFPFNTVLESIQQVSGMPLRVRLRLRDNRLIESLVAAGHGIAVLPRYTTLRRKGLVLRPLQDVPSMRHVFAVMRPDRAERLAVRRVVESFTRVAATVTGPAE